jgi:hypothetical protein
MDSASSRDRRSDSNKRDCASASATLSLPAPASGWPGAKLADGRARRRARR